MRNRLTMLLAAALLTLPLAEAKAFELELSLRDLTPGFEKAERPEFRVAQSGCKSLSEAVEQVRRKTNGRIISAETRVNKNGRETHHIKVLTKDGKVKTHKVQGCKRGNG